MIRVAILTISDKGAAGQREDRSGPALAEIVESVKWEKVCYRIIPDEISQIKDALIDICDNGTADLILTTGGTGFAPRDVTPEATLAVIEKEAPGLAEMMRSRTLAVTPLAALSRARAGIRKSTLIVNLPGSPKAARECLEAIIDVIPHGIDILKGNVTEHGK